MQEEEEEEESMMRIIVIVVVEQLRRRNASGFCSRQCPSDTPATVQVRVYSTEEPQAGEGGSANQTALVGMGAAGR